MNTAGPCSSTLILKRALLCALYDLYDHLARDFSAACSRQCSTCCTHNVLSTSIEVDLVLEFLAHEGREDLLGRLIGSTRGRRMRATVSINGLAEYCLRREELPSCGETYDVLPCPIRERDGCPVYPVRPFGCRSLWSTRLCRVDDAAVAPPLLLTVNGMVEQIIEHVDAGGLCGNMLDLAEFLAVGEMRSTYHAGMTLEGNAVLSPTRPNPGFLIPDEHRAEAARILGLLRDTTVDDQPFFQVLHRVRARG